jgi:hypothetical protein
VTSPNKKILFLKPNHFGLQSNCRNLTIYCHLYFGQHTNSRRDHPMQWWGIARMQWVAPTIVHNLVVDLVICILLFIAWFLLLAMWGPLLSSIV